MPIHYLELPFDITICLEKNSSQNASVDACTEHENKKSNIRIIHFDNFEMRNMYICICMVVINSYVGQSAKRIIARNHGRLLLMGFNFP